MSIAQAAWMKPEEIISLSLKLVGILTLPLLGMTRIVDAFKNYAGILLVEHVPEL